MTSNRIEITRPEFYKLFSWVPEPMCVGVSITNPEGTEILADYVFVDHLTPKVEREILELERLYIVSGK